MEYIVSSSIVVEGRDDASMWATSSTESLSHSLEVGTVKSYSVRVDPMTASEIDDNDRVMSLTEYLTAHVALKVLEEFIRKSE